MPANTAIKMKPADVEYAWQQLRISYRYHERFVRNGRRNVEYREGRRFTSFVAEEFEDRGREGPRIGRVPINLYWSFHRAILPMLTMADWRAAAQTRQAEHYPLAQRSEDHINWAHEVTYWDEEVELATINFLDYGRGVIRTGIGEPFSMKPISIAMQTPIFDPASGKEVPLGVYMEDMARKTTGMPGKEEQDRHIPLGHRRYPKGVVWQQSQSVEDVWVDFRARTPDDAGYMVQKHYLTGRQMDALFARMKMRKRAKDLPEYSLAADWRYLETELDKRRGDQWAAMEADLASFPLYKMYEFWWREEDVYLLLVEGLDEPIDVRAWPAPVGQFPYRFLEASSRQDRPNPISEFTGLAPDQDQISILNSMATDAARRLKALILYQKQLLEDTERKKIERAGPLSTIGVRHDVDKVIKLVQIEQNLDQWIQTIMRLEANARKRFGIIQEQMGSPSDVDTATQSMMIGKSANTMNDARVRRLRHFLKRCCEDHQQWTSLAWHLWPEARGRTGARIYRGAMGLPKDGQGYYPMEEGFTYEEVKQKLRWKIDVLAQSPADREEKIQRIERWWDTAQKAGVSNNQGVSRYLFELYEVDRNDMLHPEPNAPDPAEEHDLILQGQMPKMSPYENYARHHMKHEKFINEVISLMKLQKQNPQQFQQAMRRATPSHLAYLKNPKALDMLMQHDQITEKMAGGGVGGTGGQSPQGGGSGTPEGAGTQAMRRTENSELPFGTENTKLATVARGGV